MSIKRALPLLSLFCFSASVSAVEEFHHKYVQLNYAKDAWMLDSQYALNDSVYATAFIERSEDFVQSRDTLLGDDISIRAITLGAGLFTAHKIGNYLQVYGGIEAVQNSIETEVKNKSIAEDSFISYRPKVGVSLARQGGVEFDFNIAYNIADFDYDITDKDPVYNEAIFQLGFRYHLLPALTISSTYDMSFSDDSIFDTNNITASIRLNFQ